MAWSQSWSADVKGKQNWKLKHDQLNASPKLYMGYLLPNCSENICNLGFPHTNISPLSFDLSIGEVSNYYFLTTVWIDASSALISGDTQVIYAECPFIWCLNPCDDLCQNKIFLCVREQQIRQKTAFKVPESPVDNCLLVSIYTVGCHVPRKCLRTQRHGKSIIISFQITSFPFALG